MIIDQVKSIDNFVDSQGFTPLMLAVKNGLHDTVNYMSLRGCNMN
jgi:ankyrin repeat protein